MQRSSSLVSMSNGSKHDVLPTWDPQSGTSKKEVAQDSLAASLVHLVPIVIILCAVLLWFFSYPGEYRHCYGTRIVAINSILCFYACLYRDQYSRTPQAGDREGCTAGQYER